MRGIGADPGRAWASNIAAALAVLTVAAVQSSPAMATVFTYNSPITGTGNVIALAQSNAQIIDNATITASGSGSTDFNLQGTYSSITISSTGSLVGSDVGLYVCGQCGYGAAQVTSFLNEGTINAPAGGVFLNDPSVTFATITNVGAINTAYNANGINNDNSNGHAGQYGTVSTLNNYQGVFGSGGAALTYTGQLPTDYNVIVNGSSFGQLDVASPTGTMAFNIYGNTGTSLVSGVDASVLSADTTYADVLEGFSSLAGVTGTSGTYDGISYNLVADPTTSGDWDLVTGSLPEPATLSLLAAGVIGLATARRRGKAAA